MLLEHYISLLSSVSSAQDGRFWWRSTQRLAGVGDFNRASGCLVPGRAPSELDRVIKLGVRDVILYLTLGRPARRLRTGIDSWVKPLQSPGSLCSGSTDDKSFSGKARRRTRARAHTHLQNTCTQSYYVTPALRRVWHMLMRQALPVAGSATLSSTAAHQHRNQSHFHLHHLSSSHWWREGVAIIVSPASSGGLTNVSPYVSLLFFCIHKFQYLAPDTCNEQKLICKVTEFL